VYSDLVYEECSEVTTKCQVENTGKGGGTKDGTCTDINCRDVVVSNGKSEQVEVKTFKYKCRECGQGFWSSNGAEDCTICPAGTFSTLMTATSANSCQQCTSGKFSSSDGSLLCYSCDSGTYADGLANTGCTVCPAGKYASGSERSECTNCPGGKYLEDAGTDKLLHNSGDDCKSCSAGKYSIDDVGHAACSSCPAGKRSNSGSDTCDLCPDGKYSEQEWSYCSNCVAGRCVRANAKRAARQERDKTARRASAVGGFAHAGCALPAGVGRWRRWPFLALASLTLVASSPPLYPLSPAPPLQVHARRVREQPARERVHRDARRRLHVRRGRRG
jgi:rubredoxin